MNEIKVKAYGIVNLTRKQYTIVQVVAFSILLVMFLATFFINLNPYLFGHAQVAIAVTVILELVETYFMMRKFNQKSR